MAIIHCISRIWPMSLDRLRFMTIKKIGVLLDMMLSAMVNGRG